MKNIHTFFLFLSSSSSLPFLSVIHHKPTPCSVEMLLAEGQHLIALLSRYTPRNKMRTLRPSTLQYSTACPIGSYLGFINLHFVTDYTPWNENSGESHHLCGFHNYKPQVCFTLSRWYLGTDSEVFTLWCGNALEINLMLPRAKKNPKQNFYSTRKTFHTQSEIWKIYSGEMPSSSL